MSDDALRKCSDRYWKLEDQVKRQQAEIERLQAHREDLTKERNNLSLVLHDTRLALTKAAARESELEREIERLRAELAESDNFIGRAVEVIRWSDAYREALFGELEVYWSKKQEKTERDS